MHTSQLVTGPIGSEQLQARRYKPYRGSRTRRSKRVSAKADATNDYTTAEEKEAPVGSFYRSHIPRVAE